MLNEWNAAAMNKLTKLNEMNGITEFAVWLSRIDFTNWFNSNSRHWIELIN